MLKKRNYFAVMLIIFLLIFTSCSGLDAINGDIEPDGDVLEESQLFEVTAESSGDYVFNWTYYLYVPEGVNLGEVTRIVVEPASDPDKSY